MRPDARRAPEAYPLWYAAVSVTQQPGMQRTSNAGFFPLRASEARGEGGLLNSSG